MQRKIFVCGKRSGAHVSQGSNFVRVTGPLAYNGSHMKFAVFANYTTDKAKTAEIRPFHRKHLGEVLANGKLAISGPFIGDAGGLFVYETDTQEECEALLKTDPFVINGIITSYTIYPWNAIFFNPELLKPPA